MYTRYRTLMGILFISLQITSMVLVRPATPPPPVPPESPNGTILFVQNAGQWPDAARFQVWGSPAGVGITWLTDDAIWVVVAGGTKSRSEAEWRRQAARSSGVERSGGSEAFPDRHADLHPATLRALKITFPGSNPDVRIEPLDPLTTTVSYFLGNDPAQWRPAVPVYGGVRYVDLYPDVDLVLGQADAFWRLESQRDTAASFARVRVHVEGADAVAIENDTLVLTTGTGEIRLSTPHGDVDVAVDDFEIPRKTDRPADAAPVTRTARLPASPQNDPADLIYATYLGGAGDDTAFDIDVDAAGRAYVVGVTYSSNFPVTPGAFDIGFNNYSDVFVARTNPAGTRLEYATFLGGGSDDAGLAIAVDATARASITGQTLSCNFPTTPMAFDTTHNGGMYGGDTFVAC